MQLVSPRRIASMHDGRDSQGRDREAVIGYAVCYGKYRYTFIHISLNLQVALIGRTNRHECITFSE